MTYYQPRQEYPVQDYINLLIAYGTITGSSIAAIALFTQFISNRSNQMKLQEELQLAKDQMRLEFRPWLGKVSIIKRDAIFDDHTVPLDDTKKLSELEAAKKPIIRYRYRLTYRNYGKLPVLYHNSRYKVIECKKDEEDCPESSPSYSAKMQEHDGGTMMPTEEHFVDFEVRYPFPEMVFLLCSFDYEYATGKGAYRFILELKDDGTRWAPIYNITK